MLKPNLWTGVAALACIGWATTALLLWPTPSPSPGHELALAQAPHTTHQQLSTAPTRQDRSSRTTRPEHSDRSNRHDRGGRREHRDPEARPFRGSSMDIDIPEAAMEAARREVREEMAQRHDERHERHFEDRLEGLWSFVEANYLSDEQAQALEEAMSTIHEQMGELGPHGPSATEAEDEEAHTQRDAIFQDFDAELGLIIGEDLVEAFHEETRPRRGRGRRGRR